MRTTLPILTLAAAATLSTTAHAQHLWWNTNGEKQATDLYGEITVLATAPHIYYCGANWHPGEPAGGYCGIQHNSDTERRTIFSIWDTSPTLHPTTTAADPKTIHNRFGGEGEGGHTHMIWNWKINETFQFYVHKQPGPSDKPNTTDTFYYIYDRTKEAWLHSATINNPNGDKPLPNSVSTIGGGLNSFLENFAGKDKENPKLALYRLWLGTSIDTMKCLTKAGGDGTWGQMHNAYFLAEGDPKALEATFAANKDKYGEPTMGGTASPKKPKADKPDKTGKPEKPKALDPIPNSPISEKVIEQLKHLPVAPIVPPTTNRPDNNPKPATPGK